MIEWQKQKDGTSTCNGYTVEPYGNEWIAYSPMGANAVFSTEKAAKGICEIAIKARREKATLEVLHG